MNKTVRWIGNILVLAGAVLLIWQFAGMKQTEKAKDSQLEAFANLKAQAGESSGRQEKNDRPAGQTKKQLGETEGILNIPQIDIAAPVSYGSTPEILDAGFGAIPYMDEPGTDEGAYAIAGHQSHVFGEFFNRLDELQTGSRFQFETIDETQEYEVYQMKVVEPEEVSAIAEEPGISKLSLITCYPQNSDKQRLIVMAKRVND